MKSRNSPFKIGTYRPIYLWGGPGTIRMNRLKFLDVEVDETAHNEVHAPEGAQIVLDELYCNWVHLTYNWGFPPEVEAEDWDAFEQGAKVYHALGRRLSALIALYKRAAKSPDPIAFIARTCNLSPPPSS